MLINLYFCTNNNTNENLYRITAFLLAVGFPYELLAGEFPNEILVGEFPNVLSKP